MGRILQGILGSFSGKVGPVVGGSWKGIAYMKSYVIPANPQSTAQVAHRTKFKNFIAATKLILPTVINNYWEHLDAQMSGFNSFVKRNFESVSSTGLLSATTKTTLGDLEGTSEVSATYYTSTGVLAVTWDDIPSGNGDSTDNVLILAFDTTDNSLLLLSDAVYTRGDQPSNDTIATGLTAGNIRVYLSFVQGADQTLMISESQNCLCTAS